MQIKDVSRIMIDARCRINYASYYIYGIWKLFGHSSCSFEVKPFEDLIIKDFEYYRRGCALIIVFNNGLKKRIYVDTGDSNTINKDYLSWSDLYAKINVSVNETNNLIFPIGPSFGITIWKNPILSMAIGLNNYIKSKKLLPSSVTMKMVISNYLYLNIRRERISEYYGANSDDDYCFSLATLWYDKNTDVTTNTYRGWFIEEASKIYDNFEGGFFYIPRERC
jgi:signal peptidase I